MRWRWKMMWNALRRGCQHHQRQPPPTHTPISIPQNLQWPGTAAGLLHKTANQSQRQQTHSRVPAGVSRQMRVCGGEGLPLKQTVGHSCWVEGIRGVCRCVCLGVCGPSQIPCTGRALCSISASKFHLRETKAHRDRKENENPPG